MKRKIKINKVYYLWFWYYSPLRFLLWKTDSHFCQFLSNFFKYSTLNFPSSYLYNIFAIYFPSNSLLLKFLSSILYNFSCYLTSVLSLSSNSTITSFVFSKSFFLSQISYSTVNLFYYTKYFTIYILLLFKIFYFLFLNFFHFYWVCFLYFLSSNLLFILYYLTDIYY